MHLHTVAPATRTPTTSFTGDVHLTPLPSASADWHASAALVRFTPGARTHWHVHPRGQVLHVTEGIALVATRDGSVVRARAGDSVVRPPGEEHWHGSAAGTFAAHLALQEAAEDGSAPVTWLEPVTDEQHTAADRSSTGRRPEREPGQPGAEVSDDEGRRHGPG